MKNISVNISDEDFEVLKTYSAECDSTVEDIIESRINNLINDLKRSVPKTKEEYLEYIISKSILAPKEKSDELMENWRKNYYVERTEEEKQAIWLKINEELDSDYEEYGNAINKEFKDDYKDFEW